MSGLKKCLALIFLIICIPVSAWSADVFEDIYSDAPANPTQDNVDEIRAQYLMEDDKINPYSVQKMEPTRLTVDVLDEIFTYVDIDQHPPVRYFPEATQLKIEEIIGDIDPDALYIPEFMSLLPEVMLEKADILTEMQMNIDYIEGQLVVVVLGRETEDGVEWEALPADAVEENIIRFVVPEKVAERYAGDETLFVLMTIKPGHGENEKQKVIWEEEVFVPSKNASNIICIVDEELRNVDGEVVDCEIRIVPQTKRIIHELANMNQYFADQDQKPIRYFDEDTVNEVALILQNTDIDTLIAYEVTQVMSVDYQEPYGDVVAKFSFPTRFREDKAIIALIGMPERETDNFYWMPLRAEKEDELIQITFSSSVLPEMMNDAGILLVMSEPIEEWLEEYYEK